MIVHSEISQLPREERIRRIAYVIWEEEGRPHGCDLEHWNRATELVDREAEAPQDPGWLQRLEPQARDEAPVVEVVADDAPPPLDEVVSRLRKARSA